MDITLKLNARFQPQDRFDLEDALEELLTKYQRGEITGGGTAQNKDGEIAYCDIELSLTEAPDTISWLVELLSAIGIPKGSLLHNQEVSLPVGTLEGLAFYSNGQDLPNAVYEACDINFVVEEMEKAMEGIGRFYSYWEGDVSTALYFYGTSFAQMKAAIAPFVASYPLCEKSRIEQIA